MSTCLNCNEPFTPGPARGGRVQAYCGKVCQVRAANQRRASTRSGRLREAPLTPKSTLGATAVPPELSTPPEPIPSVDRLVGAERLAELMDKAHSRTGINAFELATLARLRGISPWTPARLIMSKDYRP